MNERLFMGAAIVPLNVRVWVNVPGVFTRNQLPRSSRSIRSPSASSGVAGL
jgi:hypothetical protein